MNWPTSLKNALARGVAALSPNCREAARLQSDALDRKLPFSRRVGLRIHLVLCKWCRRYGKQLSFLRAAVQKREKEDHCLPTLEMSPESRERIKQKIQAGQKQ